MKLAFQGLLTFLLTFVSLSLSCTFVYMGFDWVTSVDGRIDRGAITLISGLITFCFFIYKAENPHD